MYLHGELTIDPSQLTQIERIKPTKAFARFANLIFMGALDKKQEVETFTAISILQQFNMALRKVGIDNVVRLAKDDVDFYLDSKGRTNDLKDALEHFKLEVDQVEAELFDALFLVVEHEDTNFRYLIEIRVNRTHKVGEYPIEVTVNGLIKDLDGSEAADVKSKMQPIFTGQDQLNQFATEKETLFAAFVAELRQAIQSSINLTDIREAVEIRVIRPSTPVETATAAREHLGTSTGFKGRRRTTTQHRPEPVYGGYYGFDTAVLYTLLWTSLMVDSGLDLMPGVSLWDQGGELLGGAGDFADMNQALDPSVPLDDVSMSSQLGGGGMDTGDGSFFDSFSDFGGGGCSSCSSCGGCAS